MWHWCGTIINKDINLLGFVLPWCASAPSRPHLYAIVRTVDKTYSQSQSQNVTTESNKNSVQQRCTSLVDSQQPTPNYRADFLDHCQRRELNSNHQSARSQLLRSQRKKQKTNSLKLLLEIELFDWKAITDCETTFCSLSIHRGIKGGKEFGRD